MFISTVDRQYRLARALVDLGRTPEGGEGGFRTFNLAGKPGIPLLESQHVQDYPYPHIKGKTKRGGGIKKGFSRGCTHRRSLSRVENKWSPRSRSPYIPETPSTNQKAKFVHFVLFVKQRPCYIAS